MHSYVWVIDTRDRRHYISRKFPAGGIMPIVAISRQMGSLGSEIAERVAAALKVPLIHSQIQDAVAARWGMDLDLIRGFRYAVLPHVNPQASLAMAKVSFIRHSLMAFATQEARAVFRGWGAAQFLPALPNVVRVFIGAPLSVRVKRVSARHKVGETAAENLIKEEDGMKARLARDHARVDWTRFDGYELCINTGRTSVEDAVSQVVGLAQSRDGVPDGAAVELLQKASLEALARATLLHNRTTRSCPVSINATAKGLAVVGIVDNGEQREAIISSLSAAIRSVPIHAQIRARTDYRTRTSSI